jgi:plastocyanin
MNKVVLGTIVTVVAVLAIGGVIVANKKDNTSKTPSSSQSSSGNNGTMGEMPNSSGTSTPRTSDSAMPPPPSDAAAANAVTIKNFAFAPTKLQVKKGTTVTWTNQDDVQHTVTPDNPSDTFKESQLLAKAASYSVTFNTVGTYAYHCSPHPYMKATIEVVE